MDKTKAVFLDRDGTIIYDVGYPKDPNQIELLPEIVESLKELQNNGFKLIIISNQSGIGRGILTIDEVEEINRRLISTLGEKGVFIDASYYCPHAPDENCSCRKPSPEMLFNASKTFSIDLSSSFMVGDKISDIEAGKQAGCKTILFGNNTMKNKEKPIPDLITNKWSNILSFILGESLKS